MPGKQFQIDQPLVIALGDQCELGVLPIHKMCLHVQSPQSAVHVKAAASDLFERSAHMPQLDADYSTAIVLQFRLGHAEQNCMTRYDETCKVGAALFTLEQSI